MSESTIVFADDGQTLDVGAHVCAFHESPDAVLATIARSFTAGLNGGERCACAAPGSTAAEMRRLLDEAGVDASAAEGRGDLVFMTDRDPSLKNGNEFDPDHLLEAIKGLFGQTVEAGYAGLRLTATSPASRCSPSANTASANSTPKTPWASSNATPSP